MSNIKNDASFTIGIDIGGSSIKAGLVSTSGELRNEFSIATEKENIEKLQSDVVQIIKKLSSDKFEISGIGIATTGIVDNKEGRILESTAIKNYNGMNWREFLSGYTPLNVVVENDVKSAAWGEYKYTNLSNADTIALIAIGTGIGCGIVINGSVYHGSTFAAGEIGYISIDFNGPPYLNNYGCLELYASATSIVSFIKNSIEKSGGAEMLKVVHGDINSITVKEISQAEKLGNPLAIEAFSKAGEALGVGIVNLVHVLNPNAVILGGGVVDASNVFTNKAIEIAQQRILKTSQKNLEIRKAQLGNHAATIGAGLLAWEYNKDSLP